MSYCSRDANQMLQDPGFGYARIVLASQLSDPSLDNSRVRIVGRYSMEHLTRSFHHIDGNRLTLSQHNKCFQVHIGDSYHSEHNEYLYIEVLGYLHNRESNVEFTLICSVEHMDRRHFISWTAQFQL